MAPIESLQVNLNFSFFIIYVFITVVSSRFAWYSYKNRNLNDIQSQNVMWEYYTYLGLISILYGLFGLFRVITRFNLNLNSGILMGFVLLISINMREIYYSQVFSKSERQRQEKKYTQNFLEIGFVLLILVSIIGEVLIKNEFLTVFNSVSTIIFLLYGFRFGNKILSNSIVEGTGIDTLTRNLFPIFLFSALAIIFDLTIFIGLSSKIIVQMKLIFLTITATTLMMATIKLKQNIR